ncbi:MAG: ATP-binding protein [Desulfocapsaceae bacterium]|nr:ATP-binding protein [Desulfocapsaceae bacterium]
MHINAITSQSSSLEEINRILRGQLQWMLFLRVVLYTLLLGVSFFLGNPEYNAIVLPKHLFILLILTVYLTSIGSAILLAGMQSHLRTFAFCQNLLDTFFASLLVYFTGASQSIFSTVFFFPIISGGLITPRKGGLIAAAAATLQYATILGLEYNFYYPSYFSLYNFVPVHSISFCLEHISVKGLTFFLAALLSTMFGNRLKKTEAALSSTIRSYDELAILYKQIFDNINTGIITLNADDIITSANEATGHITGYHPSFLIGKKISALFPSLRLRTEASRLSDDLVKNDGTQIRIGYSISRLPQSEHPLPEARKAQILDENKKLVTLRNIGEIEKLERQLRQREKMAAIGMMSAGIAHDFRNPLTAISGSAQVLAAEFSTDISEESQSNYELATIIVRESNRLIATIADFLKFARPENATKIWFSLGGCLNEVIQVCRANPSWPATCRITMQFDSNLDIWADERQFFTVFSHLINNAVAYCPADREEIIIAAHEQADNNGQAEMLIDISDNGPGIPQNLHEKIFEPFFTRRADGTGLGLAIVRQTIHEHQGTIKIGKSEAGGARFTISLPLP